MEKEVFLTGTYDSNEANIIMEKLKANGIPSLAKNKHAGGPMDIIMGMSIGTIDIYVPEEMLEEAKKVLEIEDEQVVEDENNEVVSNSGDSIEDELYNTEEYNKKDSKKFAWFMVLIVLIPLLSTIIYQGVIVITNILKWSSNL